MIRRVLAGASGTQEIRLRAVNRRGRTVEVQIVGAPLSRDGEDATGAILVMEVADPSPDAAATPSTVGVGTQPGSTARGPA
jgi:hypothetical protein